MTAPTSLAAALATDVVMLDGGLATQLEDSGHDLSGGLWSARLLADDPDAVTAAHLAFLRAGASVVTTASYQATVEGFVHHGHDRAQATALLRRSVALARTAVCQARDEGIVRPLWIAASVGPYGAALADGSEYRGGYGLTTAELTRFHQARLRILADAGPDVLACETIPDIREAEALLTALAGVGVPAWLSFTIHHGQTRAGQPLAEAFDLAREADGVIAVGVNCCAPAEVTQAVRLTTAISRKPAVAYPNSGETWDPVDRRWTGPSALAEGPVTAWVASGARLIGGCCRVTPAQLARLASEVDRLRTA